ncbi:MAG: PmoA family protein [Verrucomicrobia bacterium]|nr:PmoA family protein [Verrucomicrobiota bacterium]
MRSILFLTTALLVSSAAVSAAEWKITVKAGAHERSGSIVMFTAPLELTGDVELKSSDGASIPVQVDQARRVAFIEPQLAKGAAKTYTLAARPKDAPSPKLAPPIKIEQAGDTLKFTAADGKPVFSYQMNPGPVPDGVPPVFRHGAYLHPVFSPGGKLVTGDHPADHRWHRGIWFAWTKTEFEGRHPDFWNQGKSEGPDKAGARLLAEVRFSALKGGWSGRVNAGFVSEHKFIDHSGGTVEAPFFSQDVLNETWQVVAYRVSAGGTPLNVIDLTSAQSCAGSLPLKLPKYHYGGLGVRGHALWDPVKAVTMLTSNGDNREKGDSTKAKWVHMGGDVDGQPTGLAVLIHPANFRFPQPLRLNPKNPQLCIAPSQDGDWEITPGKPYVSRYRIIVADGKPDAALLEKLWADYANPVAVELKAN